MGLRRVTVDCASRQMPHQINFLCKPGRGGVEIGTGGLRGRRSCTGAGGERGVGERHAVELRRLGSGCQRWRSNADAKSARWRERRGLAASSAAAEMWRLSEWSSSRCRRSGPQITERPSRPPRATCAGERVSSARIARPSRSTSNDVLRASPRLKTWGRAAASSERSPRGRLARRPGPATPGALPRQDAKRRNPRPAATRRRRRAGVPGGARGASCGSCRRGIRSGLRVRRSRAGRGLPST